MEGKRLSVKFPKLKWTKNVHPINEMKGVRT